MEIVSGISESARAYFVAHLALGLEPPQFAAGDFRECCTGAQAAFGRFEDATLSFKRTVVVLVANQQQADELTDDLRFLVGSDRTSPVLLRSAPHGMGRAPVLSFPSWEVLPFDALSPTMDISASRLYALYSLLSGDYAVVVITPDVLMQRTVAPRDLAAAVFKIHVSQKLDREHFIAVLDGGGYRRTSIVEECGQIAVRGAIVDFFPPGSRYPMRVELSDDIVESIRLFDPVNQRSLQSLETANVIPVREIFLGLARTIAGAENYQAAVSDDERQAVGEKLRHRASELSVPSRAVSELHEVLTTGASWPGLEHLLPLVADTAVLTDYLQPGVEFVAFDTSQVFNAAESFANLVAERAQKLAGEAHLFVEPETAYQPAAWLENEVRARCSYTVESLVIGGAGSHNGDDRLFEAGKRTANSSDLKMRLQQSRHSERPLLPVADDIARWAGAQSKAAVVVSHRGRIRKLRALLEPYGVRVGEFEGSFPSWLAHSAEQDDGSRSVTALVGLLSSGLRAPADRFSLIVESDLFPEVVLRRRTAGRSSDIRRFLGAISQFKENDFVVHADHGIGLYRGLKAIEVEGKLGDFLCLEYAEEARLFLPVEQIGKVQKYIGISGANPALSKLGGRSWIKTKEKVRENVVQLAGQLVNLYAEREIIGGHSYGPITTGDQDFADTFTFEETPDQAKAIDDVLADMAKDEPMDRLVCGDVGYGKTEVALRAAFKAAHAGKQVAVLVPTTILADQHFSTFRERFGSFALEVGCVSRFFSAVENRQTLERLAKGTLDVVIGTHRLLQRDVRFKDLGLLIIDEEHRFGVAAKERLKRFRREVDVLTLTATPIPRTLHMSLVGIRDLSVIETPPVNRQAIRTYVAPYEPEIVREALVRELSRGGQSFFIYNRVQNIASVADEVRRLVPEARIAFAHGQMKERQLEDIMHRFLNREIDVLVSTTIVESGIDVANANTLVVRDAERFGLAELYQLRGRIGRSSRRAHAYLLTADPRRLGYEARKRLEVLQALDDLGQGFRLALQDMEIRGAGNLLGKDQSGQVHAVGFELYAKIMEEAVREIKQRRRAAAADTAAAKPAVDPEMQIGCPAHIPTFYIPDVAERLLLYQRLVELRDEAEGARIAEEIEDRFGRAPEEVGALIDLMLFRSVLRRMAVTSARLRNNVLSLSFHTEMTLDLDLLQRLVKASAGALRIAPNSTLLVQVPPDEDSPDLLSKRLRVLARELGIAL